MNNPYIVNIYSKYNTKGIFLWALTEFKYKRVFSLMAKGPPLLREEGVQTETNVSFAIFQFLPNKIDLTGICYLT